MDKLEINWSTANVVAPREGCVLMVCSCQHQRDWETVFCEFAYRKDGGVVLVNCRAKSFLIEASVPCDYAVRLGNITVPHQVPIEFYQLPVPAWFHRREKIARALARRLANQIRLIGVADIFSALAGVQET